VKRPAKTDRHFEVVRAIRGSKMLTQTEKHLLHVIESYADNATGEACPGTQRLAADMAVTPRTVERLVRRGRGVHWLACESGASKYGTNIYRVTPVAGDVRPERATPDIGSGVEERTTRHTIGPTPDTGSDKLPSDLLPGHALPPPDASRNAAELAPCCITRWTSLRDPASGGLSTFAAWRDLFAAFAAPLPSFASEHDHPGWSPARFDPMRRANENARDLVALVLDYDNKGGSNATIEQAARTWGRCFGLIHTTKRHAPTVPRWRMILPFSRPVSAEEHARIWEWARQIMAEDGIELDASTRDPSRFWFWPCSAGGGVFETRALDGAPLPVDRLLTFLDCQHDAAAARAAPSHSPSSNLHDKAYAAAALRRACEALESAPRGERNTAAAREAYALGGLVAPRLLDRQEVARELEQATRRGGWDRSEERRTSTTIRRQLRAGEKRPRDVPDRPLPAGRTPKRRGE